MAASALPPGPRAPAPLQTARWLTRHVELLESCRREFGETFTLRFTGVGPLTFVTAPAAAKQLFGTDREHRLPSGRQMLLEPVLGPRSLLLLEGGEHLRRRRLMLPAFHGERMRAYERTIAEVTAAAVERWPLEAPFAIRPRTQAITLEVILRAVFGVRPGPRHDELRGLLGRLLAQTRRGSSQIAAYLTRPLGRLGPWRPLLGLIDRADELLAAEIADRRGDPHLAERGDILSLLIAARFDDGAAMDDAELRDQLMTLLVAGHETTATALAWAFDLLLHTPGALDRARAAAEEGDGRWLEAVGHETQRLRPVITSVGRTLGAPGDYVGFELPAGASLMVSTYLMQTRSDLYPDPYAFRPERFADLRPETYQWMPFGGGVRRCIGAAFAELEIRVVLGEVLRRLELAPAAPRAERPRLAGITLVPEHGVRVRASRSTQPVRASSRSKTSPALRR